MPSTIEIYTKNIIFLKVLGFRSISIVNGKSVTKPTDVLYLIVSISFGIFICYLSILRKDEFETSKSAIANYGNFISYVAAILVSVISMCCVFYFRHRLWDIMLKFADAEEKVFEITYDLKIQFSILRLFFIIFIQFKKIDYDVDYTIMLKRNARTAGSLISLIFPLTALVYFTQGSIIRVPLYFYASLYFSLSVGSVTVYVVGIYFRLVSMRNVLKLKLNNFSYGRILFIDAFHRHEDVDVYGTLADIYSDLIEICDEINSCFGFQLMLSFGLVFFYSLFTSFSIYTDFVDEGRLSANTISSALFCAYFNFFLTVVILTCNLTEREVRVFSFLNY